MKCQGGRKLRPLKFLLVLVALLATLTAFILFLHSGRPKSYRYLIPSEYAGWLCLSMSSFSASPLPLVDGFKLVQFNSDGYVETSDEPMPSQSITEYFRYSSQSTTPLNLEEELGGGYTYQKPGNRFNILFWVSKTPHPENPLPSWKKPTQCE